MIAATIVVGDAGMRSPLDEIENPAGFSGLNRTTALPGEALMRAVPSNRGSILYFPRRKAADFEINRIGWSG
jgi:hypothetical protein